MRLAACASKCMTIFLLSVLVLRSSLAGASPVADSACRLRVALYGANGSRIEVRVLSFELSGHGDSRPSQRPAAGLPSWKGSEISFPRNWIGRSAILSYLPIESSGKGDTKAASVLTLHLPSCELVRSIRTGELEQGHGDSSSVTIEGAVTGCPPSNAWWIRASAIFGQSFVFEGQFDVTRGSFSLDVVRGARYILVIGKGARVLRVTAMDVVAGARNILPPVNMSGSCE
jgi:hypothetical protein